MKNQNLDNLSVLGSLVRIGLLAATACGEQSDGECGLSDRSGGYIFTYTETEGDCGDIFEGGLAYQSDFLAIGTLRCTLEAPDMWSNNSCTLERSMTCDAFDVGDEMWSVVAVSTQDDDASEIFGTVALTWTDSGGSTCSSVYHVTAERQ